MLRPAHGNETVLVRGLGVVFVMCLIMIKNGIGDFSTIEGGKRTVRFRPSHSSTPEVNQFPAKLKKKIKKKLK